MFLRSGVAVATAFAVLASLVAAGVLHGVDQWAVHQLMPGLEPNPNKTPLVNGLVPLRGADWNDGWSIAADIVLLPGSFLIALAIVAWRSRVLAVMLLAAVAVEVLCKEVMTKPDLYERGIHVVNFDSSFPSGHTLRIVLLVGALYPLLRGWVVAWAVAAVALILLAGWHVPTDVAGGLLLGALGLLGGRAAGALRARGLRGAARARG